MEPNEVIINVRKIVRSINLESKQIQKRFGVSIPQVLCLTFLQHSTGFFATQKEIKEHLNLNASTVSGIVQRLEAKGLIVRMAKKGDKRVTHWTLTASGDRLISKVPPLLHQRLSNKLSEQSEQDLQQIQTSLLRLINLLQIEKVDAFPIIGIDLD
jgi:DNA-binding MarR family transcriptional regulator